MFKWLKPRVEIHGEILLPPQEVVVYLEQLPPPPPPPMQVHVTVEQPLQPEPAAPPEYGKLRLLPPLEETN